MKKSLLLLAMAAFLCCNNVFAQEKEANKEDEGYLGCD